MCINTAKIVDKIVDNFAKTRDKLITLAILKVIYFLSP